MAKCDLKTNCRNLTVPVEGYRNNNRKQVIEQYKIEIDET